MRQIGKKCLQEIEHNSKRNQQGDGCGEIGEVKVSIQPRNHIRGNRAQIGQLTGKEQFAERFYQKINTESQQDGKSIEEKHQQQTSGILPYQLRKE